ncbi:MAG: molecular chaperone DnaK [Gemmataceae bacterium]|nr:molecular chaperone DnaK [Gemmataceae bacterium]
MTPSVIGIDLGTTNSLAAYVRDGKPRVVRDATGAALVPSALCFPGDGSVLVGTPAKARALADPEHTIFSVKRLMGRTLAELAKELPLIPHQIIERDAEAGRKVLHVEVGGREYTPEELSAMILREVRQRAGGATKAVITVPAYFDDAQRQATRDAGRIAGLDVLRIVNEPTAAALAYGLDRRKQGLVAVYDLGGGTFDCSILRLADGVFQVLATNGDTRLGGDDFDRALMAVVARDLGVDLSARDAQLLQHLRDQAERVKIRLSALPEAEFAIDLPDRAMKYRRRFTRDELETLIAPEIDRTLARCRSALKDAGVTVGEIDEVVLVGGATRVPLVRRRVEELFGRKPHTELNPDEVVALGAAVQADILTGGRKDMLLLDVVPLSLGIETLGGVVDKLIYRNSAVPARARTRYTTAVDNQTAVEINVYQGERELAEDCRPLGKFKLAGIPPMPAQFAQVDVTFLVDANGLLTVSAAEQRSGTSMKVTVQPAHGLSEEEIERLVLESVDCAHADFQARLLIELRNKAEGELRHTEKGLAAAGDRIPAEGRQAIEQAIAAVRAAQSGADPQPLRAALDGLAAATRPLAEEMMNAVVSAALKGQSPDSLSLDSPGVES